MKRTRKTSKPKLKTRIFRFSKTASATSREHVQENVVDRLSHIKNIRLLILEWVLLVLAITFLAVTQSFWYKESYAIDSWGKGGTYTEATLGKVNSLNPLFASTSSEKTLSRLMFGTLAAPDYSGHTGPNLAASIKNDDTGLVWTVKLRDGLEWSDGEPLTTKDVLYTVKVLQSPDVNTSYSSSMTNVKVEEPEDGSLKFTLPAAYAGFASALNFPILPEHVLKNVEPGLLLEDSFSAAPVTSGPFSYNATQTVGTDGEKIVYLAPNPSYFQGAPLLDSFAVHAYTKSKDIVEAMKTGSATATADLLPTDAAAVEENPLVYEKQTAISSGVYTFFNTKEGAFSKKQLRQAVQKGLDMRSLRAPTGDETPLDYPLTPTQIEIKEYPGLPKYDPEAAKAEISGLNIEDTVRLATVNTGYLPAIAENLKYQLETLGLNVELTVHEPGQDFFLTVLRPRDYDALIYEVELGSDPDLFAYYHSSQATATGLNLSNYSNSLASDLLLAARSTMDSDVRTAKYESFLKLWVEDVPAIGIYQANISYYVNKNVRTFSEDDRLVTPVDRFNDVSFWATEKVTKNRTP